MSWEDDGGKYPTQYKAEETYIDVTQNLVHAERDLITLDIGPHKYVQQ